MYTFPKRLVTCGSAQRNAPLNLYATTTGRLCLLKKIKTRVFRTVSAAFDSMVQQRRGGVGKWDAAYQHTPISSSNFKGVLPHQPKVWGQIPEKKGHDFRNCASRRGLSPRMQRRHDFEGNWERAQLLLWKTLCVSFLALLCGCWLGMWRYLAVPRRVLAMKPGRTIQYGCDWV